jgi:hypothetical protein
LPKISRVFSEALDSSTYGSSAIASVPPLCADQIVPKLLREFWGSDRRLVLSEA